MNRLYKLGIAAALYCVLSGCSGQEKQYKPNYMPAEKGRIVYGLHGKDFRRTFIDIQGDKTLDEVVISDKDGRRVLKPGDQGFEEQNEIYKKQVLPKYRD